MKVRGRPPAATSGRPPSPAALPALPALPAASCPLTPFRRCVLQVDAESNLAVFLMEHGQGGRMASLGWAWGHVRADGACGRPTAARARVPLPLKGRRDGPWGTRAAVGREAGGRASLLWRLCMDRRFSGVSIVFCGSESSLHAVGCVCRMGPRTTVSYVPYVSLLRSMRACIYWYIGITKRTRRVVTVSATFKTQRPR